MHIIRYTNPKGCLKDVLDSFLNKNDFFDVPISSLEHFEWYYVAYLEDEMVGVRKVLTDFETWSPYTYHEERFKEFYNPAYDTYYLQAIAVLPAFRGQGIGTALLHHAIEDIPKNACIFTSLCEANTIKNQYIDTHGFSLLKSLPERTCLGRFPEGSLQRTA
ncbi:GNAT family N-acetyltransferase [Neptuniibacter sp. QD37_11]|uniref:GNAT family N-acetyltransferase n=1 Tax=Neptuniibacter sp. QD37_11 TaxID=3398209 RepID=UPI0039F5FD20